MTAKKPHPNHEALRQLAAASVMVEEIGHSVHVMQHDLATIDLAVAMDTLRALTTSLDVIVENLSFIALPDDEKAALLDEPAPLKAVEP